MGFVPVPGVVCGVQFPDAPASSVAVVTTRLGAVTAIWPEVTVRALFAVSVAVNFCCPLVLSAALKVPVPAVRIEFAGSLAAESVLVNRTVPG